MFVHEDFIDHPKILKAGAMLGAHGLAQAIALYLAGLSYAKKHATDGAVPDTFVHTCTVVADARKVARVLAARGVHLWHRTAQGYTIHDYFDFPNEHAEEVKEQRRATVRGDDGDKEPDQRAKWREQKARQRGGSVDSPRTTADMSTPMSADMSADMSTPLSADMSAFPRARDVRTRTQVQGSSLGTGTSGGSAEGGTDEAAALARRADQFVARYAELFRHFRHGAKYLGRPDADLAAARQLVAVWDDARLDLLVEAFLVTDDPYCRDGSGTITHFRSRASWLDSRLREAAV